jgi:EAL domain-containing protein (putative c-di-GMP-specific phosphodiesterase class I)
MGLLPGDDPRRQARGGSRSVELRWQHRDGSWRWLEVPIDVLKVDRSFVAGLPANRGDAAIVRAVVGLSRAFGLRAVAEGVETPEQLAELRGLGCDQGQGYLFGRPSATEVADVMLRRSSVLEAVPA